MSYGRTIRSPGTTRNSQCIYTAAAVLRASGGMIRTCRVLRITEPRSDRGMPDKPRSRNGVRRWQTESHRVQHEPNSSVR